MSKSITRLYVSEGLSVDKVMLLNKPQSHYLINVMRLSLGSIVSLFNGFDGEWCGVVNKLSKKHVGLKVKNQIKMQIQESKVHLCFAVIKNTSLSFLVEKATELGVSDLHPIFTDRTVVRRFNVEKCLANVIEAAEQSERLTIPKIHSPKSIEQLLQNINHNENLYYCEERRNNAMSVCQIKQCKNTPYFLIGPEGGFSTDELHKLDTFDRALAITLGKNILRSETAGIAVLAKYF